MAEIRHRSRSHTMRGQNVLPVYDVAADPDAQPVLLRLGLAVGDINASGITRAQVATVVASAVMTRKRVR